MCSPPRCISIISTGCTAVVPSHQFETEYLKLTFCGCPPWLYSAQRPLDASSGAGIAHSPRCFLNRWYFAAFSGRSWSVLFPPALVFWQVNSSFLDARKPLILKAPKTVSSPHRSLLPSSLPSLPFVCLCFAGAPAPRRFILEHERRLLVQAGQRGRLEYFPGPLLRLPPRQRDPLQAVLNSAGMVGISGQLRHLALVRAVRPVHACPFNNGSMSRVRGYLS